VFTKVTKSLIFFAIGYFTKGAIEILLDTSEKPIPFYEQLMIERIYSVTYVRRTMTTIKKEKKSLPHNFTQYPQTVYTYNDDLRV